MGVSVELADLGTWGEGELYSEYDPSVPVIRINVRALRVQREHEKREFVMLAIGHELYHHLESIGAVSSSDRRKRERVAETFARSMLE